MHARVRREGSCSTLSQNSSTGTKWPGATARTMYRPWLSAFLPKGEPVRTPARTSLTRARP